MAAPVFHRPLRICTGSLWLVGAGLAAVTSILALSGLGALSAMMFAVVAAALIIVALGTLRATRWAVLVSVVLLGGQGAGVVGSAWELVSGVAPVKARELRALGFSPTVGVALNLVYSAVAFALFCWWVARRLRSTTSCPIPAEP
jgi:hypothetical protein